MQTTITKFDNSAEGWERALYAFLAEKERRSGSRRTVEGYSRMLQHFFATVGKPPDRVTSQEVFAWGYGVGLSGKQPSSVTIGARLACLSSFYRFLIRMDVVSSNPCDALERPRLQVAPPRGLTADDIRRLLAVVPETPVGLRDRAIILTLTLTGRRRAEVLNMPAGDLTQEDGKTWYRYRGKGNKQGKASCRSPRTWRSRRPCRPSGGTSRPWSPERRCGPPRRVTGAASRAGRSGATCRGT
jgi:site-specific recombinase XerD